MILGLLGNHRSLKDLRNLNPNTEILTVLDPETLQKMEKLVPASFSLPRRPRTPILYKLGETPVLESRLQDFFGLKQTPAIMNGKINLKLSLLAPNKRPVQVTSDIAGFWERTYPEIRRTLSRQYPKHAWPENPLKP